MRVGTAPADDGRCAPPLAVAARRRNRSSPCNVYRTSRSCARALLRSRMAGAGAARGRLPHLRSPRLDRADLTISLRVPGEDGHFLINPFGHYREVCASNLVKIDIDGNVIGHSDWPINPAGFTFHSAIHAALRCALRDACAHDADDGRVLFARRAVVLQFLFGAAVREDRVSRLRGHHRASRRGAAHRRKCRRAAGAAAAQPWARDDRRDARADVLADVAAQSCV